MIKLINFADHRMTLSQKVCTESAYKNGVDDVWEYKPRQIDAEFFDNNKEVLKQDRGAGYWLWKPYIINRAMNLSSNNDVLIYCDSGVEIISGVNHIINAMDQDIFLFSNGHQHVHWCKGDVMDGIIEWQIVQVVANEQLQQAQASVIFIKVNQFTRNFIKEWLLWCQMPGFIDDSPSLLPNHPEFAEHRHDQAILTCLAIKYRLHLHWWADSLWYESQRFRWPEDKYPSMFRHHRKRNDQW